MCPFLMPCFSVALNKVDFNLLQGQKNFGFWLLRRAEAFAHVCAQNGSIWVVVVVNDLLLTCCWLILGLYQEIRSPIFFVRSELAYRPSNPVSKSFITWHHHFSNKNDRLARPTHCSVRVSNVYNCLSDIKDVLSHDTCFVTS